MFHAAPLDLRAIILKQGLLPSDPSARDWSLAGQPIGVYVTTSSAAASLWGRTASDIWAIDASGLPIDLDHLGGPDCRVIRTAVPPQRLRMWCPHR